MMRLVILGKAIEKVEQDVKELKQIAEELKELKQVVEELRIKSNAIPVYGPQDPHILGDSTKAEIGETAEKIKTKKGLIRGGAKNTMSAEESR